MRLLWVSLAAGGLLFGQTPALPWAGLQAENPTGFSAVIRLIDPRVYQRGEVIPANVTARGLPTETNTEPSPKVIWSFSGLLLEPESGCGSVKRPCWGRLASGINGHQDYPSFNDALRRPSIDVALNAYLPPLNPGRYRTAALWKRLDRVTNAGRSNFYQAGSPPGYAVSSTVEFEVRSAEPAWVRGITAKSLSILRKPQMGGREEYAAYRAAAQRLRFLDEPEAWRASLDALPAEQNVLLRGLEESRRPEQVCALMRSRISSPQQVVSQSYLSVATRVCLSGRAVPPVAYYREMQPLAASLAASLPTKQAQVKTEAIAPLFEYVRQVRFGDQETAPPWVPDVRREFIRSFNGLEASRRAYIIELASESIESPELVPLLVSVLDGWKPGDYYEAPRAALLGLYQIDPARAQARILAELTKPQTWLDASGLDLLPASAVPFMDDELIEALARDQLPGGWNPELRMAALARFATPRVLPRIKAIYESQQEPCQPELVAYFVRSDPAFAERVFRRHPWDMLAAAPPCTIRYFDVTPRLAMGPVLEEYLVAYLMHHQVSVKQAAARSLGGYGSSAALKPLWDAFRYFHEYWKGKGQELVQNGEGIPLEVELRNAIARGANWVATETDLRIIESLCISGRCLDETRRDLDYWRGQLRINLRDRPGGLEGDVAHYLRLPSLEAVKAKLTQFPEGTRFTLIARGPVSRQAVPQIRALAARKAILAAPAQNENTLRR